MSTVYNLPGVAINQLAALLKLDWPKSQHNPLDLLPAGAFEVDFVVRIHGTVQKAEDPKPRAGSHSVPWQQIALVALSKLNAATVDRVVAAAIESVETKIPIECSTDIEARARAAVEKIKGAAPEVQARGAVKATLFVDALHGGVEVEPQTWMDEIERAGA